MIDFHQRIVMFEAVEGFFDAADFGAIRGFSNRKTDDGAGEAVFSQKRKILRHDQLDRRDVEFPGGDAEVFKRSAVITPTADGVADRVHFRNHSPRRA